MYLCMVLGCAACSPINDLDEASSGAGLDATSTPGQMSVVSTGGNAGQTVATDASPTVPGSGPMNPSGVAELGAADGERSQAPDVSDSDEPGGGPGNAPVASGGESVGGEATAGSAATPVAPTTSEPGPDAGGGMAGDGAVEAEDLQGMGGAAGIPTVGADGPPVDAGTMEELPQGDAAELPIDLPGNPVAGTFTVAVDAEWEVNGEFVPTFEIISPSASYWLVKPLGMIVSIMDAASTDARQWIDYSSGFRPLRGLPSFGTFDLSEPMTTTADDESQSPTHLRIHSVSESGSWRLVYDFYPTHVTLTVNAAPTPYGIAYRGVPAGLLDTTDQFVFADGSSLDGMVSSVDDLLGPVEWAYIADPVVGRSLFLIQHGDDDLTDRYQVKDNDSAMFSFGDGELTRLPMRFSFGLIESVDHEVVASRAAFVIDAIE